MIRVVLPYHLQNLAGIAREVRVQPAGEPTLAAVLDALEAQYPVLRGTIRDQRTFQRRAFIRFYACGQDWSHEPPEAQLPQAVIDESEPLRVVGAMAGG